MTEKEKEIEVRKFPDIRLIMEDVEHDRLIVRAGENMKKLAELLAAEEELHPLEKKYGVEPPIKDFDPYRWL